jgi:hypothetical protein
MNSFTLVLGFALIAAAAANGHGHASSYVSRSDSHGHHTEVTHGGHSEGGHGEKGSEGGHDDKHVDYVHHPAYNYEYGVSDPKTKDHHTQWEHRDGDKVHGEYTLDEADGTKRIVKYSSDKKGGFTAHVENIGHATHPQDYGKKEEEHEHGHH